MSRQLLFGVLVVLAWYHLHEPDRVTANGSSPVVDSDIRQAVAAGFARVLVEVRVPQGMTPEGELPRPEAVAAQRGAIAAAQGDILSRLPRTHFTLVRQYETVPYLALEIDGDALTALERMGDVVARVLSDRAAAPAARPGVR